MTRARVRAMYDKTPESRIVFPPSLFRKTFRAGQYQRVNDGGIVSPCEVASARINEGLRALARVVVDAPVSLSP